MGRARRRTARRLSRLLDGPASQHQGEPRRPLSRCCRKLPTSRWWPASWHQRDPSSTNSYSWPPLARTSLASRSGRQAHRRHLQDRALNPRCIRGTCVSRSERSERGWWPTSTPNCPSLALLACLALAVMVAHDFDRARRSCRGQPQFSGTRPVLVILKYCLEYDNLQRIVTAVFIGIVVAELTITKVNTCAAPFDAILSSPRLAMEVAWLTVSCACLRSRLAGFGRLGPGRHKRPTQSRGLAQARLARVMASLANWRKHGDRPKQSSVAFTPSHRGAIDLNDA